MIADERSAIKESFAFQLEFGEFVELWIPMRFAIESKVRSIQKSPKVWTPKIFNEDSSLKILKTRKSWDFEHMYLARIDRADLILLFYVESCSEAVRRVSKVTPNKAV